MPARKATKAASRKASSKKPQGAMSQALAPVVTPPLPSGYSPARKAYHQRDPVKLTRSEVTRLPFRDDVEGENYQPNTPYRSRNPQYADEVFYWVPYDKKARRDELLANAKRLKEEHGIDHKPTDLDVEGEWQMCAVDMGEG